MGRSCFGSDFQQNKSKKTFQDNQANLNMGWVLNDIRK